MRPSKSSVEERRFSAASGPGRKRASASAPVGERAFRPASSSASVRALAPAHKRAPAKNSLPTFIKKAQKLVGLRGTVNVVITDDDSMCALNKKFRKKNKPTDVLSFPSDIKGHAGDIAISKQMASAYAKKLGHSLDLELKVLALHGILHLAGYDHETDDGQMASREASLRKKLGLPVSLTER